MNYWIYGKVGAKFQTDAPLYEQQVALTNEGAKELGYADTGAIGKYDMPADDFAKELDRIWGQVKPLYDSLHCHVRAKLGEKYGEDKVPQDQQFLRIC